MAPSANRTKRVLLLHGSDEAYGSDRICHLLALALRSRGHDVTIGLPDDCPNGWLSETLTADGFTVERMPLGVARRRHLTPTGLVRYAAALWTSGRGLKQLVKRSSFDAVYINSLAILPALLPRRFPAKRILHCHEIVAAPAPMRMLQGKSAKLVDAVICVSDAVARNIVDDGNVWVCNNGIPELGADLQSVVQRKVDQAVSLPIVVTFVGRLSSFKAIDVFLDAAAHPWEADVEFHVVGGPVPGETHYLDAVHAAAAAGTVRYHGEVDDTQQAMVDADILVVPSRTPDPYPTVVLEGLRAGAAVIATDGGGAADSVLDGHTGRLIPMEDLPALIEALGATLSNTEQLAQWRRNARADFVERHQVEAFNVRLDNIYEAVGL